MNPKSRAHRSFRSIPRFEFLKSDVNPFDLLDKDELPIGLYKDSSQTILISDTSLYVGIESSDVVRIPFASVASIRGPDTKTSQQLEILTSDEHRHVLKISGGNGKFKDVYSFVHFLQRVLEDNRGIAQSEQTPG